ncbi:MAG: hypothetical protein QM808_14190 [Steroidobacteraceae bacterium]
MRQPFTPIRYLAAWRWWALLLVALLSFGRAQACTATGCVSVGPRLASITPARGALLNGLLGNLTGTTLSLTVGDWNTIAQGDISLLSMLSALQTSVNASTPTAALSANATLAQIVSAAATTALGENNSTLSTALNTLKTQLALPTSTIKLGDLLSVTGTVGTARVNVLDLVSGVIQLYNSKNVTTTPSPIGVSTTSLGLTGILTAVQLSAQVVEPPVYVCGPTSSQFHTATIRVLLNLNLVTLTPNLAGITSILGISSASATIANLDVYLEIARANGSIYALDAIANSLSVKVTPGVSDIYLGYIDPTVFFNRSHSLISGDLDYATIGSLKINGATVADIQVKSYARGQSPSLTQLDFTGSYPQTLTASTNALFASNFATSLINNLQMRMSPAIPVVDAAVLLIVKPATTLLLGPVLSTVLSSLANPLLELIGVRLGEVDVTADGVYNLCSIAGVTYNDSNHSGRKEYGEAGSGLTLYAKLVYASTPSGPATQAVTVDTSTGIFSFSNVTGSTYTVLISTNNTLSDVAATLTSGWIATEVPSMTRSITISSSDSSGTSFGIYNGSKLSGNVFKDDGTSSGTANNGTQDGGETGIAGISIKVTDSTGNTSYDSAVTATNGTYSLWIPATAGANTLKVVETSSSNSFSTGGSAGTTSGTYTRSTDTTAFTHVIGSTYTGVNFADVPANRFEPDGQQTILPGNAAFYRHNFVAGSAGQLTLSGSATALSGWNHALYLDSNCNGVIDSGEVVISSALNVTAAQTTCVIAKVMSPTSAPFNTEYPLTLSASFSYANSALNDSRSRNDMTMTGVAQDAALVLGKTADKSSAKTGDTILYTITYTNRGNAALQTLKVYDDTPAYTTFNSAACGTLGTGLSGCSVTTQPAVTGTGAVIWQFTGNLAANASGTVTFTVTVQ